MDESAQNHIIRQGGACELLSFIIDALLPAEKIKKMSKKKGVKIAQKKVGYKKKPYQKKLYQKRESYQPKQGYQTTPFKYNKFDGGQKTYQTSEKVMRHRRPRISRPAAAPPTDDMLTVDTGNFTL